MSGTGKKTVFDLNTHCLAEIFKYLKYRDLMALEKASAGFHDAVLTTFRAIGEISLESLGSIEQLRAFFRGMPFKIRKLDLIFYDVTEEAMRTEYLPIVLSEVDLSNVTHLSMFGFEDLVFFKEIMSRFRNVRSIDLFTYRLEHMNIMLDSIAALEEISILARVCKSPGIGRWNEARGSSKFSKMLKKHGPRLRAFELMGQFFCDNKRFQQLVINILSEFAPNLESFKSSFHDG